MKTIYPSKLKQGDMVRVIAPAMSLKRIDKECQRIANERFAEMGLQLEFSAHANEIDDFGSSSIDFRIRDFHQAFLDEKVKAVIAVIGGFNSNQLLSEIDWDIIRSNPKIFCGFSDITALNNAIYAKTGLVNYSGPAYASFGKQRDGKYTIEYFRKCLFSDDPIEVVPSKRWDDRKWWIDQSEAKYFRNKGWQVIQSGSASGTIIGGNLCTLNLLQGTLYMPPLDDAILFLEDDYESNAVTFDRDLVSLIHQPGFEKVRGIIIGRFQVRSAVTESLLEQVIKSKKELKGLPVIAGVDFGHTDPKITFPIGGEAKMIAGSAPSVTIARH